MSLRAALALLLVCGSLLSTANPARASEQLSLHAKRINFYVERLAVIADGGVHLSYPGGLTVSADALYIDLRADRYVWAGHAHAVRDGRSLDAPALSIEHESETIYALAGAEELPRVERYQHFDLTKAEVVAPPADGFSFPPLREFRPYIYTSHATIVPKVNIRFTPALFPTGAGIVVPSPSYLYSYVPNPNFGASALTGSNFDQPYGLLGSERALTSAHFRYDSHYGAGIALTQQFVYGDRAYVAMGVGPLRRDGDTASLLAYQRIDATRSQTLTGSSQQGLQQVQYRFNQGVPHGLVSFSAGQANAQATVDLGWTSDPFPIGHSGFSFRLHADYGFDHNVLGLLPTTADPTYYPMLWRTTFDTFVASPTFWGPLGTRMNVTLDGTQTFYAYPHQHYAYTLGSTISRKISKQLNFVGQITDQFSGDAYPGRQLLFYPPPTSTFVTPGGIAYPGYSAFTGYSSQRTYSLTGYYTTIPPFVDLRMNFTYARDFPQYAGYGRPPYSAGFDLRYRPGGTVIVELGRNYTFQWGSLGWSPQWTFSISQ